MAVVEYTKCAVTGTQRISATVTKDMLTILLLFSFCSGPVGNQKRQQFLHNYLPSNKLFCSYPE
jgi:hypothetical protein